MSAFPSKLAVLAAILSIPLCPSVDLRAQTPEPAPTPARTSDVFNVRVRFTLVAAPTSISLDGITDFSKLRANVEQSGGKITMWGNGEPSETFGPNWAPVGFTGNTGYARMPGTTGPATRENLIDRGVDFRLLFHDRTAAGAGLRVKVNDNRETPDAADNLFEVNATLKRGAFTLLKLGPPQKDSQIWLAVQLEDLTEASETSMLLSAGGKLPEDKRVDFKFTAADGQEVDTAKLRGKVILVDFWATWCGPCVEALPRLQELYDHYHKDGLEIVGINLDSERSAMDSFLKRHQHPWPQSVSAPMGKNALADRFAIQGIPFFLLIDKTGVAEIVEARDPHTDDLIVSRLKP